MRLPLSEAQLGVWHALRLDPAGAAYDIGGYAEILGPLDAGLLERAGTAMVAEVDAFRVRFDDRTEPVTQLVTPPAPLPLRRVEMAGPAEALAWMHDGLATPRDPTRDPLLEITLIGLGPGRHWWFVRSHHLVLDGYSVPLVCGRVAEIYTALSRGVAPAVSSFGPYRALLDAETAYRASPRFAADRAFWLDRMAGAHDVPTLSGRTGPALGPFHRSSRPLPEVLFAHRPGRAWVPVVMAAFAGYLARLTGADELRLGVPVTGRSGASLRVPGNAANLLPLRIAASATASASDLAAAVGAELRQLLRHQRYRGEDLARDLGAVGAGPALFGPSVNIRDFDHGLTFGSSTTALHDVAAGPVEDLTLSVRRAGGRFTVTLDGNAGAYSRTEVDEHLPRFIDYLAAFAGGRRAPASGRPLRGPSLDGAPPLLADAFAAQARRTPEATALRDGAARWTFAELAARVSGLAGALQLAGVRPDDTVALALPRSAASVIAMLAVARAGGAWLPIDPRHPARLGAARPALVLADELLAGVDAPVLSPEATAPIQPGPGPAPANLAYVIHTSGSTGTPRAVEITQGAVANLLAGHRDRMLSGPPLRVAHTAPFTVDAAVDPLLWMVAGHELVLLPEETYRDPYALVDAVRTHRLDLIDAPPSYLRELLDAGLLDPAAAFRPSVIVFGGEAASAELWTRLRAAPPGRRLNAYGPTEFTVDALLADVSSTGVPVLGTPVAGSRALVLDAALHPVPEGGVGELYLGGPGLARGYAGQPGLTATRFVADPSGPPGTRLFRTGDLVRVLFEGNLQFLGRTDDQLKIRGFRVEPREVETVLAAHPGVRTCAVVSKPGPAGPILAAYVVPRPAAVPDLPGTLLIHLRSLLPDHLVPAVIVALAALPLAADGSLDRRALPDPGLLGDRPYRPPVTPAEAELCAAFAEVLGAQRVGVDDDFFALGGHSLLAGRLLTVVRTRFGAELTLRMIFTHRTPRALAQAIDAA